MPFLIKNKSVILAVLLLCILLLLSHNLRKVSYYLIPDSNGFLDERTNVWVGLSIRSTGVPTAWSDLSIYKDIWKAKTDVSGGITTKGFNIEHENSAITIVNINQEPRPLIAVKTFDFGAGDRYIDLVQPYLDHPPLGGLILSSLVSNDAKDFGSVPPTELRKTSLYLANITFILLFILGWLVFKNPFAGLITSAVYGFSPTYNLVSRYALLENVLIPLSIAVFILIYLFKLFPKKSKFRIIILITASILAGLSMLVKVTGIYILVSALFLLWIEKVPRKTILSFGIGSLCIGFLYFIWGFYLLPEYFFQILQNQSSSRIFAGSLPPILNAFKFGMRNYPVDGWWIGGFLTIPLLFRYKELHSWGVISLLTLFILVFVGAAGFPWYFMIFIPFMCIATTNLIIQIYKTPSIEHLSLFFFVFFLSTLFWGFIAESYGESFNNHQYTFTIFRAILLIGGVLLFAFPYLYKKILTPRKWAIIWTIILLICLKLNITSIQFILVNWDNIVKFFTLNWGFY